MRSEAIAGWGIGIIALSFWVFLLYLLGSLAYNEIKMDDSCLEEIAKDYCSEKGFIYKGLIYSKFWQDIVELKCEWQFSCYENNRSLDEKEFRFTEEEIKRCGGREK